MWVSFVVLFVLAKAETDEEFCTSGIPTSLARARNDDLVDIFYMEAPVSVVVGRSHECLYPLNMFRTLTKPTQTGF